MKYINITVFVCIILAFLFYMIFKLEEYQERIQVCAEKNAIIEAKFDHCIRSLDECQVVNDMKL